MSQEFLLVLCAAFGAGCIDAIVGGGGLIQAPALFSVYANTPPAFLLGTNKFAAIFGTANAAWRYSRKINIAWRAVLPLALWVLVTAASGAVVATRVPPKVFRPLVPILLSAVLLYILRNKTLGDEHRPRAFAREHHVWAALLIGAIGFYDGFFGPGTGSFLMFVFIRLYGYDFLNAAANARVLNVATNLAALTYFGVNGYVLWQVAVGMAVANVAGSMLGTRLALRGGNVLVRKIFIVVVSALILRTLWVAISG
ncbi:MAG: TSUP family transporter [Steroidobacteraceae bacterium]